MAAAGPAGPDLSLAAELLLLTVDPARGGLLPRNRRRFRRALAHAHRLGRGGSPGRRPWGGFVAQRHAMRELTLAGLIERAGRRVKLRDRALAAARFRRLRSCLATNDFPEPRDRQLALLLAWSGVLRARLSREERRIAARRLRELVRDELDAGSSRAPLSGKAPPPAWAGAMGKVAYEAQQGLLADTLEALVSGDFGGDFGGVDPGSGGATWDGR